MIFSCIRIFIVQYVFLILVSDAAYFSDVHWSTAIKLSEYDGFRSATILSFNVPPQSLEVTFSFQAKTSGTSCTFREIHIYLQHGSYPLVRPYNETFPPKFYTSRRDWFHVKLEKDAEAESYTLPTPRPGLWYMAAFLPKPTTDKIQQKGLDKSCLYGMFVVVESSGLDNVEEISTYETHTIHLSQQTGSDSALYRFKLAEDTVVYTATLTDCVVTPLEGKGTHTPSTDSTENNSNFSNQSSNFTDTSSNYSTHSSFPSNSAAHNYSPTTSQPLLSSNCPVTLILESEMMPSNYSDSKLKCGNVTECQLTVASPNVKGWNYILVQIDNTYSVSDMEFMITFTKKACSSLKFMLPKIIYMATQGLSFAGDPSHLSQDDCIKMNALGRFILDEMTYNITYLISETSFIPLPTSLESIRVPDFEVLVTNIVVQEFTDIGGTLRFYAQLNKMSFNVSTRHVVIYLCLMKNSIPGGQTVRPCTHGVQLLLNSTSSVMEETVYIPYPESGSWFLGLNSHCFDKNTMNPVRCDENLPTVYLEIGISGCVDGQCGEFGVCQDYISGVNVFSSCKCVAGWRGYGCTDGTNARSRQHELMAVLLLTLSNLLFLPAMVLALYRRYFVEAAVYTYTMFFSTFYHACDASDLIYYCMLDYDVLSFADFLGSISSFWVTMLAMAEIPSRLRSFAQTLGALGVAVGVEYDRHGLWVFAIPAGLAGVIMFASWIVQCKKQRRLYPDKKYFVCHLLPGVVLAITGLVVFAFLETEENYLYTHSAWHVAMSLSIVFLLPSRHQKDATCTRDSTDSTDTILTDIDVSSGDLNL